MSETVSTGDTSREAQSQPSPAIAEPGTEGVATLTDPTTEFQEADVPSEPTV